MTRNIKTDYSRLAGLAAVSAQPYTSQNKCALEIRSSAGESIIRILYTGQVELSPRCNVDEAASIFWENVQEIGVKLAAAQPDTHMRELAAYRLTVENLEQENAELKEQLRGGEPMVALAGTAPAGVLEDAARFLALEAAANQIFNNPPSETSQDVRDVIEWFSGSIRVVLDAARKQGGA